MFLQSQGIVADMQRQEQQQNRTRCYAGGPSPNSIRSWSPVERKGP